MAKKGRHRSLGKNVKLSIKWLESIEAVTRVVIGFSECCRHKYPPGYLKVKADVSGGFKLNAYSGNGVTDIFVKIDPISERESVKKLIADRF